MPIRSVSLSLFSALCSGWFAAVPLPGSAQGNPAPIAVDDCHVTTNSYYFFARPDQPYVSTRGLAITFRNRGQQPVVDVRFRVNYRGENDVIDDAGSFTPGTKIADQYQQFVNFAYLGPTPNSCRVIFTKSADGTTWTAPETRRQAQAQ
jgi:hypothetical protein